jgi:hypothetical protein
VSEPFPAENPKKISSKNYFVNIEIFNEKYLSKYNSKIIPQPYSTLEEGKLSTIARFLAGQNDRLHMNHEYGEILWRSVISSI